MGKLDKLIWGGVPGLLPLTGILGTMVKLLVGRGAPAVSDQGYRSR